eukprot:TRINITY_DN2225_c0_g1_i1.p1 TRINITY_DN2225_c0_g1~~TRINITY_DN2225_c0_g1_i1.p1  ORF type:complete len:759 (-),score=234.38 TRINITY_DN2225_c0_g1_i1:1501-3750(-)
MASQSRAPSTDGVRRRRGAENDSSGLFSPRASVSDGRGANGGSAPTASWSRPARPLTSLLDRIPPSTLRGAVLLQAVLIVLLAGAHVVALLGGRSELPTFLSPLVEGGFLQPAVSAVPSSPPTRVTTSVRPNAGLATARLPPPSPTPRRARPPPPVDFAVTIYTYNRPRLLANLLGDIAREAAAADVTVAVNILDDASLGCIFQPTDDNVFDTWDGFAEAEAATAGRPRPGAAAFPPGEGYAGDPYLHLVASGNASEANRELRRPCASSMRYARVVDAVRAQPTWRFFTARYRHGRRRYWHLVATAHRLLRPSSTPAARFYLFLPDDDRLAAGFFSKATAAWTSIPSSRKMTLLLHIEASREAVPVWTDVAPKPVEATGGAIVEVGWVESGNFMTTARFLDEFRWSFRRIDPSRWVRNPPISSGVGAELSTFLHRNRWRLYRTHGSLLAHVSPAVSQMNGPFRLGAADATHRSLRFADGEAAYDALLRGTPSVTASMASTYRREAALHAAVASLLPQVDALNVYLNDYDAMPRFLVGVPGLTVVWAGGFGDGGGVGDLGDRGKFFWAANLTTDFHFTVDDDIVYPPDYVATLTAFADAHAQPVAVGAHGIKVIPEKLSPPGGRHGAGYYGSREVWMGVDEVSDAVGVHILGTGTLAYRVAAVGPLDAVADFPEPNMADVWFGVLAQRRRLPLVVAPHSGGWLREVGGTAVDSLYGRFTVRARADRLQTRAAKAAMPWVVHPATLRGAGG